MVRRYNFFEQHDIAEVERKFKFADYVVGLMQQWGDYTGVAEQASVFREIVRFYNEKMKPQPTVGDLKPGDFAVFITANDFWEGIKFSINRRKNTADGNNVSIYPLNGKCTAIQVSKLTPCKIVEG